MAVTFSAEGAVGTITLDHPPANSYDLEVMRQFSAAVDEALAGDVIPVIVRSASEKFFCAGADIKKFLEGDIEANMEMIRVSQAAFKRMAAAPQVFIAHIAGHALGGGLELAQQERAQDVRTARAAARGAAHATVDTVVETVKTGTLHLAPHDLAAAGVTDQFGIEMATTRPAPSASAATWSLISTSASLYCSGVLPWTRSLTPMRMLTRSGFSVDT